MLFLLAVLVGVAAAIFALLAARTNGQALGSRHQENYRIVDPQTLRPLFAPTDEELRAADQENEERERLKLKAADEAYREEQEAGLRRMLSVWRDGRSPRDAAELLERAAMIGEAELFAELAEEILKSSSEQGTNELSRANAAALVESHLRLLPQEERSSGALFWVKEEVARLRKEG